MRIFFSILLSAFLAASVQAKEFEPSLFFGAANALSQVDPDTQEPFIRIACTKNINYRNIFTLDGRTEPHLPSAPTQQSLSARIEGRIEGNHRVHGEVFQSDIGGAEARATLVIGNDKEELALGDLTLSETGSIFPLPSRTKGAKFRKRAGSFAWTALITTPEAAPRTDRMMGNGTQGPYRLSSPPIVKGSERVRLMKGMKEKLVPAHAYRIDYNLGTLTFTGDMIERDQLIQITYLQHGASDGLALNSLKTNCSLTDATWASVHIVRTSDAESAKTNTYTSWAINSKSKPVAIQSELALIHTSSRAHGVAGSSITVGAHLERLSAGATYLTVGQPLAQLSGSMSPSNSLEGDVQWNPGMGLRVFTQYAGKVDEGASGVQTVYGFSATLPYSSMLSCERTHERNGDIVSLNNCLILSKETKEYKMSASASSGTEGGSETKGFGSRFELSGSNPPKATVSINYLMYDDRAAQLSATSDIGVQSNLIGSATLSCRVNQSGNEKTRRVVSAECKTLENLPVQFSARYAMKCLNPEHGGKEDFQEVQEFSGSGRIKIAGFNLSYCPRLNLTGSPELSQHRVTSKWSPNRIIRLEMSGEDARYRSIGGHNVGFDRRTAKAGARITPASGFQVHFGYEADRRHNLGPSSLHALGGWRAEAVSAIDEESSLQCEVSDFRTHETQADSGTTIRRDRSIEAKASRELAPGVSAYLLAGVTRREETGSGYSYSPGVGFRVNTGRGTTAELSYRTTTWVGLPARDEEKATLQINAAETWLSATCDLEYKSLTRPVSKTVIVSMQVSLHF
ncbi:MAG: hypothetical protein ACE5JA_06710 [bacterium]